MRNKLIIPLCLTAMLGSCRFSVSTKEEKSTEVSGKESTGAMKGAIIKNEIELDASNIKVSQAYLTDASHNLLLQNEVKEGEKIYCVVRLDTGWSKYDGKSFIGASEKILSGPGNVILDEPDLFKAYTESGMSATDAGIVSVVATITEKQPRVDNYTVQFRLWDKKGSGEVTGRFKFKVN